MCNCHSWTVLMLYSCSSHYLNCVSFNVYSASLTLPLYSNSKWHFCLCLTPLYLKNWTLLDFHTWHVYTPPKWQERALTNIFSTILEAIKKGKKPARCGFFQSSRLFMHLTKHEFYITGCLNDSSFQ